MKLKDTCSFKESYDKRRQCIQSRDISLPTKVSIVKSMFIPVVMCKCELDHKEGWAPKKWCFQTVVLENTLEILLDCEKIKPVNPKEKQLWIFIGWTDANAEAEAEAPVLWSPDVKIQVTGNDPDAWKDWEQEEMEMTEDEMAGWHHWLNGHKLESTLGDSGGYYIAWLATIRGISKSWTWLSHWTMMTRDIILCTLHRFVINTIRLGETEA